MGASGFHFAVVEESTRSKELTDAWGVYCPLCEVSARANFFWLEHDRGQNFVGGRGGCGWWGSRSCQLSGLSYCPGPCQRS